MTDPTNHEPGLTSDRPVTPPPAPPGSRRPPSSARRGVNPLVLILGISAAFFVIFLAVSGVLFFAQNRTHGGGGAQSPAIFGGGAVGVVELNGVILDSKKTIKKLEDMEDSNQIRAVVLRINSPGGAVPPSQEIYQAVKRFKKPLVVSMGSVAASGGYYIACGAKKIFANAGTITGSIGVIMEFANLEHLYEWAKVKRYSIKTGKFKDIGAEYREMQPEERELLQGMVDDVLSQFKQAVSDGRRIPLGELTPIADGRVFSGSQAKELHLVDEVGTLQDAIDDVAKQAGIKGKPEVIYPEKPGHKWLDLVLDNSREDDESGETRIHGLAGALVELLNGAPIRQSAITGLAPGIYWIWDRAR